VDGREGGRGAVSLGGGVVSFGGGWAGPGMAF